MGWWEYVKDVAGDDSTHKISEKMGGKVTPSGVARWKSSDGPPKAESAMEFARAYDQPLLDALLAAELISEEELSREIKGGFASSSDEALLIALGRRLKRLRELEESAEKNEPPTDG